MTLQQRRLLLIASALSVALPAAAQTNSLLKRQYVSQAARAVVISGAAGTGVPTSQPAGETAQPAGGAQPQLVGVAPSYVRSGYSVTQPPDVMNFVLAQSSPLAIPLPPPQKIQVNDLITIIIRDERTAQIDAKLKSDKKWDIQSDLSKWFRLNPEDHLVAQPLADKPGVDFNLSSKYATEGKTDRTDSLVTRITARVVDVKPNGNLVLEASKTINGANDDEYTLTLIGECRSKDVTPQNTVLSTQLADLVIKSKDSGAAKEGSDRGWIKKLFDWAKPI